MARWVQLADVASYPVGREVIRDKLCPLQNALHCLFYEIDMSLVQT